MADWSDRVAWLRAVQSQNPWIAGWLNVFEGTVEYFGESATFKKSDYMKAADAAVLWSVMRGLNSEIKGGNTDPEAPAGKWAEFFKELRGGSSSDRQLRALWGNAEQAGVNWSTAYAADRGFKLSGFQKVVFNDFLKIGNEYRTAVSTSTKPGGWPISWIWGVADPRHDAAKVKFAAIQLELQDINDCRIAMGIGPACG